MTEGDAVHGAAVAARAFVEPVLLEKVFVEHQGRVFRAADRITGSVQDAEDVLQTVFLLTSGCTCWSRPWPVSVTGPCSSP